MTAPGPLPLSFDRTARALGLRSMERLAASHVLVCGLGGVGSFAVEALARSGIGQLTLVDYDRICVTNLNRQIQALSSTIGEVKVSEIERRIRDINPGILVNPVHAFYSKENAQQLLVESGADLVLDCIDSVSSKLHLLATCLREKIPVITALGAAGKMDPTAVRLVPLPESHNDRLGRMIRKNLRRIYRFTNPELATIQAVWSPEKTQPPVEDYESPICDRTCICPGGENKVFSCTKRHIVHGSLVTVTAVFGMVAANAAIMRLRKDAAKEGYSQAVE